MGAQIGSVDRNSSAIAKNKPKEKGPLFTLPRANRLPFFEYILEIEILFRER